MRTLLLAAAASLATLGSALAACPSAETVQALSRSILANTPAPAMTGMTSLADGQCAQDILVPLMVPHLGQPVGYKVGLTNAAAQQRFGVAHPVVGTIYQQTIALRSGGEVPARFAAVPTVEADLLVRVSRDAINQARTHLDVLRAIDLLIPFIEMPDLVLSGGMDGPNLLAINVGARLGVVGEAIPVQVTEEFAARLGTMTVTLANDQRELARAPGAALLGHPLNVIPWLAEDLARRGQRMQVGQYISLGGFSPAVPAEAGRTYTVRYEGLLAQPVDVSIRTR
jgi:2-keto-4-pentenoate hydratase